MEKWNLHRRIALYILRLVGSRPDRLVLGFMLATSLSLHVDQQHRHHHADAAYRHGGDRQGHTWTPDPGSPPR